MAKYLQQNRLKIISLFEKCVFIKIFVESKNIVKNEYINLCVAKLKKNFDVLFSYYGLIAME